MLAEQNPQLNFIPTPLPARGPALGNLMGAIVNDTDFAPAIRLNSLEVVINRARDERPELVAPVFYRRICSELVKIHRLDPSSDHELACQRLLNTIGHQIVQLSPPFIACDLAMFAHTFGTMYVRNEAVLKFLSAEIQKLDQVAPIDMAVFCRALHRLKLVDIPLFESLSKKCEDRACDFFAIDIKDVVTCFPTANLTSNPLLIALADRAADDDCVFFTPDFVSIMRSFSSLGIGPNRLLLKFKAQLSQDCRLLNPFFLATAVQTLCELGDSDTALHEELASCVIASSGPWGPWAIATTLNAFRRLGCYNTELVRTQVSRIPTCAEPWRPKDIEQAANALSLLMVRNDAALNHLSGQVQNCSVPFSPSELTRIASAYTALRYRDERLFQRLAALTINSIAEFDADHIAWAADAFSKINLNPHNLLQSLYTRASEIHSTFNANQISRLVRATAILDPAHVGSLVAESFLNAVSLTDLNWVDTFVALHAGDVVSKEYSHPRSASIAQSYQPTPISGFALNVKDAAVQRYSLTDAEIDNPGLICGIPVDFVITHNSQKYVFDCVNEATRMTSGPNGRTLMGYDYLQERVLQKMGYQLIRVYDTNAEGWSLSGPT